MQGVKVTDARIIAAIKKAQGLVTVAAKACRCNPDTIHQRVKDSPEVAAAISAARAEVLDDAESALHKAVAQGEAWAVQFTLRTLGKERGYGDEVKHTGRIEHDHMPDPERVARIVALLDGARTRRAAAPSGPAASVESATRSADAGVRVGR